MQLIDRSAVRLTFGDDLFMRRHRGLGSPVVNQFVWRFDRLVPAAGLVELRDALARGGLARQADRPWVPAARGRWSRAARPPRLEMRPDVLQPHEVMAWLRSNGATRLDPARGDSWRLTSAHVADGGMLVSLLVDHAAADGGAMVDAVERASAGREALSLPQRPSPWQALATDVHDAASQLAAAGRWVAGLPWRKGNPTGSAPHHDDVTPVVPAGWVVPMAVVECSTADVEAAASRHGGTANAWFVAVCASLATAAGTVPADRHVRVALPVSARVPDDRRSNATRIAHVDVAPADLAARDLTRVRARCKEAYAALGASPAADAGSGSVLTVVQMLPDAVLRHLPSPPAATVLASNLGTMSDAFSAAVGPPARSIAALAGHRYVDASEIAALGGGLTAWTCRCGDRTTVTVGALDPGRVPDDETLRDLLSSVLSSWDVEGTPW